MKDLMRVALLNEPFQSIQLLLDVKSLLRDELGPERSVHLKCHGSIETSCIHEEPAQHSVECPERERFPRGVNHRVSPVCRSNLRLLETWKRIKGYPGLNSMRCVL